MIVVRQVETFTTWLSGLRDRRAAARINLRIVRMEGGNFGDVKPVGDGVWEMRIDYGPGYRAYYVQQGPVVVVLLCGGDKGSQARDIARAKALASTLEG